MTGSRGWNDDAGLAATKFVAPRLPASMVPRARLLETLRSGSICALTLIAAPAGSGKSALLTSWAAEAPFERVAWLSLDRQDGEPHRFWRAVLEALRRAGLDDPLASLEVHPDADSDLILPAVVNALEALDQQVLLMLDDLQEVAEAPALAELDQLLRLMPDTLRVVVATRADPALRLGRLRVQGDLAELRAADLAFTLGETSEFLHAAGVDVPRHAVEQLWRRTEGWAAGLRLASLALRGQADPERFVAEFAGDSTTVADYLLGEVLARQPAELREFLLRISVVDTVSGELADALTGRSDSARVLARLEREHALLSSTGGANTWHRLHPLFAELLRSELRFQAPDDVPRLHAAAARWFESHGRPAEALRHAATARDWQHAAAVARENWVGLLLEGELDSLQPVLDQLPAELAETDPELALAFAGIRVNAGDDHGAGSWLDRARARRIAVPVERLDDFDLATAAVGLLRGRLRGDLGAAMEHAQTLAGDGSAGRATTNDDLRALALTQLGIAELWSGDLERARRDLEAARGAALATRRDWLVLVCLAGLAWQAMARGRYERTTLLSERAHVLAARRGWTGAWPLGLTAASLAAVALNQDRLDDAEEWVERQDALLRDCPDRPLRAAGGLIRAAVHEARGRSEEALEALGEVREWLTDWPMMPAIVGVVTAMEATLAAAMGDTARVAAMLASAGDDVEETGAARAMLLLADEQPERALAVLTPFTEAGATALEGARVNTWVLAASAHDMLADHEAAAAAIERALECAEPNGLRRPFVRHGDHIAAVLRRQLRRGTGHRALVEDLLAVIERPESRPTPAVLVDGLSERELVVLRHLPSRMSNREIAAEMFVSVNTVKTHLRAIYRKLDADDRHAAVRRARALALIG